MTSELGVYPIDGTVCERCESDLERRGPDIFCIGCGHKLGRVTFADAMSRHRAIQDNEPWAVNRYAPKRPRRTKADRIRERIVDRSLFDPVIGSGDTYQAAETKAASSPTHKVDEPKEVIPPGSRCPDCDRVLTTSRDVKVCVGCGTVYGRRDAVADLKRAFTGTKEVVR